MSLLKVWEAASASPFSPTIPKDSQFFVGFNLLLLGKVNQPLVIGANQLIRLYLAFIFTGLFGLSQCPAISDARIQLTSYTF